jgi:hypothetical protein
MKALELVGKAGKGWHKLMEKAAEKGRRDFERDASII